MDEQAQPPDPVHAGSQEHGPAAGARCPEGEEQRRLVAQALSLAGWTAHPDRPCQPVDSFLAERVAFCDALAAARLAYDNLFEHSPVGLLITDLQGRLLECNRLAASLLGATPTALPGHAISDFFAQANQAEFARIQAELHAGQHQSEELEVRIVPLRGRDFHAAVQASFIPASAAPQPRMRWTLRDISRYKRTERRLTAQYGVTRAIAESKSAEQALTRLLHYICEALGYEMGEYYQVEPQQGLLRRAASWHVDDQAIAVFDAASANLSFSKSIGLPGRVWKDNEPAWSSDVVSDPEFVRSKEIGPTGLHAALAFPVRAQGAFIGVMFLLSRQVLELDNELLQSVGALGNQIGDFFAHKQLEAERSRLASILESTDDAIVGMTTSGVISAWNSGAERMYGYSRGEMLGRLAEVLFSPDCRGELLAILAKAAEGTPARGLQVRHQRKDGRSISVGLTISPVRDPDGHTVGLSFVARDITELREAQEARRDTERLATARERLALMGELAAGVAHEFRNPLHGVLNCIDLLEDKVGSDPGCKELLDLAEEGLRRMDQISDRMLRLGRKESGAIEPASFEKTACDAVAFVRSRASKGRITLAVEVAPDPPLVPMDCTRISEALLNLLTNALDATGPGGRIEIRAGRCARNPRSYEISVRDTGCGIPEKIQDEVFKPFFTTKPPGKGSGLGLALVRRVVEEHGGEVTLTSRQGSGTTVRLFLPLDREEES